MRNVLSIVVRRFGMGFERGATMKVYQIRLFYGYEETETGIYHSFLADDPDNGFCLERAEALANMLDVDVSADNFNWNSMHIELPESVVHRIKEEGVLEYKQSLIDT